MAEGYVYILKNRYVPSLVKIGYTDRDPSIRADELSNTTGVPGKWVVHYSWLLEDANHWEQQIFSVLEELRETGEFFRLSPEEAVKKVSALLASWGAIDASGLSAAAIREAEHIQSVWEEREEKRRRLQEEKDRSKTYESLNNFFHLVSKQIETSEITASQAYYEKWKPWLSKNSFQNAFIWGIGVCIVGVVFSWKEGLIMIATAITALFAYVNGDKSDSDEFKTPLLKARQEARNAVLKSHKLGYLMDKSIIASTYRDYRGFTVEPWDNLLRIKEDYVPIYRYKSKRTGEEFPEKRLTSIKYIGYFDKTDGCLYISSDIIDYRPINRSLIR